MNRLWASILFSLLIVQIGWAEDEPLRQASSLLDADQSGEAKTLLVPVLEKQPENAKAHELLGDVFRQQGDGNNAEREYRRAIDLGNHDLSLLKSMATVQKWNRRYSRAQLSYERALEIAPWDRNARAELDDLRYQRGLTFFAAYGGWETDSTTKGWQTELSYSGFDHVTPYAGMSYADKYFYTRRSYYGKAYAFFSPTGYVKFNFEQKNYTYPVATNPIPDANAYQNVPSMGVEIAGDLRPNLRASLGYEFYRPNFFFAPGDHASNHKLSGELSYRTRWKPLQLRLMTAVLRDPDPNRTIIDKANRKVSVGYATQYLAGGGADFSFRRFEAGFLVLPNRDLDRSTDYSWLGNVTVPLSPSFKVKGGYVYDRYSSQSVFTGKNAQIYNAGVSWQTTPWLELTLGGKAVRRPIRNEQAVYITTRFTLPLR